MPTVDPMVRFAIMAGAVVVSMMLSAGWAAFRSRGVVTGPEPDPRLLRAAGEGLGLAYLPQDGGATLSGNYHGVNVIIEARWWRAGRRNRWGPNRTWEVQTTLRAAFGAKMPEGLHLRRQSAFGKFADALVNGDEIVVEDRRFDDAFLVHGNDVNAVGAVLQPAARAALLRVATQGDVWVDETSVRILVPQYLSTLLGLSRVLDALIEVVHEMRGTTAPAPQDAPLPPTMRPLRVTLPALLRKAAAAGGTLTDTGRAALAALSGVACVVEVDVEHVTPWQSPRSGRVDGLAVSGLLGGGTGRVNLQIPEVHLGDIGELRRGDRVRADVILEAYDAVRDFAEVTAEAPVQRLAGGSRELAAVRSPAAEQATKALADGSLEAILAALYVGRDAREVLRTALRGRRFSVRGRVLDAIPTPPLRVTDARLRGGLTVQLRHAAAPRPVLVRFPASRNDWLKEQSIQSEIEVDAEYVEWDEIAEAATFHEVG